ncbi:MAG: prolipoprotein diacylglyceryl transferase [Sphaerochaetaceae bacterium]|jgi:phosphatidylglycerol:prolipoprotein diacylglycerol transferase
MLHYIDYPSWISPTIFKSLPIRWYSMMYLVAFGITFLLFVYQRNKGLIKISNDDISTLFLFAIGGLIIGARLFSALFYEGSSYYWTHPHLIFWPFYNGQFVGLPGMSYHGGLIGAVVGTLIFTRRYKFSFFEVSDVLVSGIPLGYTFGRLGNFINGELWGRVTSAKWGIVFPDAPSFSTSYTWVKEIASKVGMEIANTPLINLPRHPSQLYEAAFEGVILWLFIWFIIKPRQKFKGFILGWYLIGYGAVRYVIEYFREPDAALGFIIKGANSEPAALFLSPLNISMGQIFCLLMIVGGVLLLVIRKRLSNEQ